MPRPSPAEQRMERLRAARAWLDSHGDRVKVNMTITAPVPRYQVSSRTIWMTAEQLISHAVDRGWVG